MLINISTTYWEKWKIQKKEIKSGKTGKFKLPKTDNFSLNHCWIFYFVQFSWVFHFCDIRMREKWNISKKYSKKYVLWPKYVKFLTIFQNVFFFGNFWLIYYEILFGHPKNGEKKLTRFHTVWIFM